ncbi:delta-12 fatty acid desaturase [Cladochytrium replicatum]|nr:delta-12 fatty acid desaturase [Cladochytrium replicatum]
MAPSVIRRSGKGDHDSAKKKAASKNSPPDEQKDFVVADLTLKEIKDAIPAHCFERSLVHSLGWVAHDLVLIAALFYAGTWIDTLGASVHWSLPYVLWPAYWIAQSVFFTGIWILAHECGHGGFSDFKSVNNVVGFILHSSLLVPFFSWKYSHAKHHKGNGHMKRDMVFIPPTRTEYTAPKGLPTKHDDDHNDGDGIMGHIPLGILYNTICMLIFGWPAYLLVNASGQPYPEWTSHYLPTAPIFEKHQYTGVVISNLGILATISALTYAGSLYGFVAVVKYYLIGYLGVNFWITMLTYLQHTDVKVPHYRDGQFNFVRGALSTVDRSFGPVLNYFFHHITDTHVVHHLFASMPFYHAVEATEAVKGVLGKYYISDDTQFFVALWRSMNNCKFVEDEGDVVWYQKH